MGEHNRIKVKDIKRIINSSQVKFDGEGNYCFDYYCGENINSIIRKICKRIEERVDIIENDPIFTQWLSTNPLSGYVLKNTNITINGITYDLSQDREWNITEQDPLFTNWLSTNPLSGFATQSWVQSQGYLTSLPPHTHTFAEITSKPTTLAGYGITDPVLLSNGSYANPSWLTSLAWDKLTGVPSTFTPSAHTHPLSDLTQSGATNGQVPSWNGSAWVPTTINFSPAGSNTQIQFNNSGAFGASANLTWNNATSTLLSRNITSRSINSFGNGVDDGILEFGNWGTACFRLINGRAQFADAPANYVDNGRLTVYNPNNIYPMIGLRTPSGQVGAGGMIQWFNGSSGAGSIYNSRHVLSDFGIANANGHYIHIFANGNVQLSNSGTPADAGFKLDVNGTARVQGALTTFSSNINSAVLIKGGNNDGSIFIGGSAMAGSTSVRNVVIDPVASCSSLTGFVNVIVGRLGGAMTSGSANVVLGNHGSQITTGSRNVFIGSHNGSSFAFSGSASRIIFISTGVDGTEGSNKAIPSGNNWGFMGGYENGNATNQFYFGASPFINHPYPASNSDVSFFAPSGLGTDFYGGNFIINAGRGTGTGTGGDLIFQTANAATSGTTLQTLAERMRIKYNTGNVLIGTATDSGFRLDVNGTVRVNGQLFFNSAYGSYVQGSIYRSSVFGLVFAGTEGSSYDLMWTDRTGSLALGLTPTGDVFMSKSLRVDGASGIKIGGSAAESTIWKSPTYGFIIQGMTASVFDAGIWNRTANNTIAIDQNGRVRIGRYDATYSPSAALDIVSTTGGFLPPRMTGAQAEAISSPAEGLMVYVNNGNGTVITSTGWWGYNGTTWVKLN